MSVNNGIWKTQKTQTFKAMALCKLFVSVRLSSHKNEEEKEII